jgi:hypothetical protein
MGEGQDEEREIDLGDARSSVTVCPHRLPRRISRTHNLLWTAAGWLTPRVSVADEAYVEPFSLDLATARVLCRSRPTKLPTQADRGYSMGLAKKRQVDLGDAGWKELNFSGAAGEWRPKLVET